MVCGKTLTINGVASWAILFFNKRKAASSKHFGIALSQIAKMHSP